MNIILIFLIAVSLSMDAFSLSLAYGTNKLTKKEIKFLSIIVGIYHFIMPILGMMIGNYIIKFIHVGEDILISIIFIVIGINMILDSRKEEKINKMKFGEILLFGFAVSIDSFSVGIGINNISNNFIMCSCIFSITSLIFTYLGLKLGKKLSSLIGKISTLIGGTILILFGIIYVLK